MTTSDWSIVTIFLVIGIGTMGLGVWMFRLLTRAPVRGRFIRIHRRSSPAERWYFLGASTAMGLASVLMALEQVLFGLTPPPLLSGLVFVFLFGGMVLLIPWAVAKEAQDKRAHSQNSVDS